MGKSTRQWFSQEAIEANEERLSPDHFAILMLSTGGTYASMAAVLKISMGTVRSRLNRARAALRRIIDEENARAGKGEVGPLWVMLNDAFLSIVAKDCEPHELLVRARRPGDIRRVFGAKVKVTSYTRSDYRYRAVVTRAAVAAALTREVSRIDYPNFKNSVREGKLHDAYLRVWSAMADLQPTKPYSGLRSRGAH